MTLRRPRRSAWLWVLILGATAALGVRLLFWPPSMWHIYLSGGGDAVARSDDEAPATARLPSLDGSGHAEEWCARSKESGLTCLWQGDSLAGVLALHDAPGREDLVFVDPGGPGLDLPPDGVRVDQLIPRFLRGYSVVFPVEPWVTSSRLDRCLSAWLHSAWDDACKSERSSSARLTNLLNAAEEAAGQPVSGALLESFGPVRSLAALSERQNLKWVVVASPAPPPGTRAIDIARHRANSVVRLLAKSCRVAGCGKELAKRISHPGRQVPYRELTKQQASLGLLGLATLPATNASVIADISRTLEKGGRLNETQESVLRRLSSMYSGVTADGQTRRSSFGLWAGVCPAYRDWGALFASRNPLIRAQGYVFRGCRKHTAQSVNVKIEAPEVPTLLAVTKDDTVVPYQAQLEWRRLAGVTDVLEVRGHAGMNGTRATASISRWIDAKRG